MSAKIDRTGEEHVSTTGQKMVITEYINNKDCSVRFEDGTEILHKSYSDVRKGLIYNPNYSAEKWVGQKKTMPNGRVYEIVKYEDGGRKVLYRDEEGNEVVTHIGNFVDNNIGVGVSRTRWSDEEDKRLIQQIKEGLVTQIDFPDRTGDSIRLRCKALVHQTSEIAGCRYSFIWENPPKNKHKEPLTVMGYTFGSDRDLSLQLGMRINYVSREKRKGFSYEEIIQHVKEGNGI